MDGVDSAFPPGSARWPRLTRLEVVSQNPRYPSNEPPQGLWEVVALGGIPSLASLSVDFGPEWTADEVEARWRPAFEAVAGTLAHLRLSTSHVCEAPVLYELGVAVGKLWRLGTLDMRLRPHRVAFTSVGDGLAASGEEGAGPPCPLLWRVTCGGMGEWDTVEGLILPSVRVIRYVDYSWERCLDVAFDLRRMGYRHTWICDEGRHNTLRRPVLAGDSTQFRNDRWSRGRRVESTLQAFAPQCSVTFSETSIAFEVLHVPAWQADPHVLV
jgi:hypothetical protein